MLFYLSTLVTRAANSPRVTLPSGTNWLSVRPPNSPWLFKILISLKAQ